MTPILSPAGPGTPVDGRPPHRILRGAVALAAFACMVSAGDASAQDAPGFASGDIAWETGVSVTAQVNIVFERDGGAPEFMQTSFVDGAVGPDATRDYVLRSMNRAAVEGLAEAARRGARNGHADVVAVAYAVQAEDSAVRAWTPLGVFINTTEMSVGADGQAAFSTRMQFHPDQTAQQMASRE
jgi:hypothetical protein